MRSNKGFTLIELMVVILIVAILAAVLAPMLTGRIREAKWTEGKAAAGTIASGIRAFVAEHEGTSAPGADISAGISTAAQFELIGVTTGDLAGKYFAQSNYSVGAITYVPATGAFTYTITVTAPASIGGGDWTLNGAGVWTYVP